MKAFIFTIFLTHSISVFAQDTLRLQLIPAEPKSLRLQLAEPQGFVFSTPKSPAVELMIQLMRSAQEHCDSGRYDLAWRTCERILSIDPYSLVARRMEQRITFLRDSQMVGDFDTPREREMRQVPLLQPTYPPKEIGLHPSISR